MKHNWRKHIRISAEKAGFFRAVFLIAFIGCSITSWGQRDTTAQWTLAISPHAGFVIPHHKSMEHLVQGHSYGCHLYAKRLVDGSQYWHEAYNMPEYGVDVTYLNTGNEEQLGQQFSLSYMLNLPLNRKHYEENSLVISPNGFRHWLGLGLGMGYATKRWDLETNHQAAVLGSQGNVAISLQYSIRLLSFKSGEMRGGIRLSHFSNGAFQLPNLGTNNAGLLVSYVLGTDRAASMKRLPQPNTERYILSLGVVGGLKEIPPPTGRKYVATVISLLGERRVSYKSAFGLGVDVLYDSSIKPLVEQRKDVVIDPRQTIQLGALVSYSLFFNRFSLKIQQGYYLIDREHMNGSLYHRAGLRYSVTKNVYAQLTLKTHFAKADYGELGIGYAIRK